MATKQFGNHNPAHQPLDGDSVIQELYDLVGATFPITVSIDGGKITGLTYSSTWEEGTTEVSKSKKGKIEYSGNYKTKSLTKAQTDKIDKWAADNVQAN